MHRTVFVSLVFTAAVPTSTMAQRVDISPEFDRRDILTPEWENWKVPEGPAASRPFGPFTATLRTAGPVGSGLGTNWWKAGYDTGATMASDGVFVKDGDAGGQLELVLSGLAAGPHSIVTYHNAIGDEPLGRLRIFVNGELKARGVEPSRRVPNDYDATNAFVEFTAESGKDVVVRFEPDGTTSIRNVILNGFEIDTVNPALKATKPSPAHSDEHAPESPVLGWTPSRSAASHRIYMGTTFEAVSRAEQSSPEFQAEQTATTFGTRGLSHFNTYFWRVDEVDAAGRATRGEIWRFRTRHLAFPGAEGFGRFARGGRGGRVIEVTTLDDSGHGSLRDAVEADGPRTVVFRVGGTIQLKSKLIIRNPYLTIAGQTAPGDGICIRGWTFGCLSTHDVIIRYVRIRVGDESGVTMDGTGFASTDHAIMDHCSVSWSIDEAVSSRGAKNITFQRSVVAEALNVAGHRKYEPGKGHSFAGSISGNVGSFHHNLLAHCAGRNWSLAGGLTGGGRFAGYLDIRNNVVYNWNHRTNDGGVKALDLINNYYKPGPASKVFHLLKPDAGSPHDPQQYFVAGNIMEGRPEYSPDNWANGGAIVDPSLISRIRVGQPFFQSDISTHTAEAAYESVLADVGASFPKLDSFDARVIEEVRSGTTTFKGSKTGLPGIIDSQTDVGGWPDLKGGTPPADTDHDGMPDRWEIARGLNPNDPSDGNLATSGDDYTNLEKYLDWIIQNPRR